MRRLGGDERLDEVHCLWALCPHPCCWEAEWRISEGVYRRAVGAQSKQRSNIEESLPSLTVLDVCEWAGVKAVGSDRAQLSRIPCRDVHPRKGSAPRIRPTDPSFPAINPAAEKSQAKESSTRDKGDHTAHISPLIGSPWTSGSFMLWVTNPHHVPQCLKRAKPPHCTVRQLICPPAARTQSTPKANRKGATKRVRLQYTCSPSTFRAQPVRPGQLDASAAVDEPQRPGDVGAFLVKNKPAVVHSAREKKVRPASQDAPASLYKLDSKTGEEGVDWDSLRGQPYLWRRRNIPPELISPPGGTRGAQVAVGSSPASKASSDRMPHSTRWFKNSNPSPDSLDLRIITGEMEPWGRISSLEHLCTSIPSLNYL